MAILGGPISGCGYAENEALLSAIRGRGEGFADWRMAGCDSPMAPHESMWRLRELDAPYFCALIADRADFKRL